MVYSGPYSESRARSCPTSAQHLLLNPATLQRFGITRVQSREPQILRPIAVDDMKRPNGLAFSPDEKLLYVVDTPGPGHRTIQVYDVVDNGTRTANGRLFCAAEPGGSDGFRVDVQGNLWCGWSGGEAEDGIAVYAPDGNIIGRVLLPERCANLCFGGIKRNRLFMAASQSVYSLYVETQGAVGG